MIKIVHKLRVKDIRITIFIIIMLIGTGMFWVAAGLTDWQSTQTVFFRWTHHFFMDWFGELRRFGDGIYDCEAPANYPALCFIIYRFFYSFLVQDVYNGYALRSIQQAMIPFFILNTACMIGYLKVFSNELHSLPVHNKYLLIFVILMSGPFLFLFERGNLFMIALLCTFIYLMLYDSENKIYRLISYLCLAVAAAIKIYPAIFGIFSVIKRKMDREVFLLIALGVTMFFGPFAFFGGIEGFKGFVFGLSGTTGTYSEEGFGYDFGIYNLCRLLNSLFKGHQTEAAYIEPVVVIVLIGIIGFICAKEFWQQLCMCSLLIVFIPKFSMQYTLCFLLIPLIYLFKSPAKKIHGLYLIFFIFIFYPWIYMGIDEVNYMLGFEFSHLFSIGHIFMYVGLLGMFLTITLEGGIAKIKSLKINKIQKAGA